MKRAAALITLTVAIAAAAWLFTRPQPIAVAVTRIDRGAVVASIANTRAGTVDACRRAGIAPATGGQIARLAVQDGDYVEEGQILLELWNEDILAELELAERDAQATRSRQREVCIIADVARRDANRLMRLYDEGLSSEDTAERATGSADSSAAACEAASDLVDVNSARIDVVKAHLERSLLRAPFNGVVAEINGELGEFVTPSPVGIPTPPTVDLIDTTCLYISAPIDEVDAPLARSGMTAHVSLDAFSNQIFDGEVRRVAPYVLDQERQARTVEIEVEIKNAESTGLLPGYSADVEIILDSRTNVIRMPTSAALPDNSVYVLNENTNTIEKRAIETGISNWEYTEVRSGLSEGDILVTSIDREGVTDGAIVRAEQSP